MEKRYIKIPESVAVTDFNSEEDKILEQDGKEVKISFVSFVRSRTNDVMWGQDIEWIDSAVSIRRSIKGKAIGDFWELDLDDWERLCTAIRKPSPGTPYNPAAGEAIKIFKDVILSAPKENPLALFVAENVTSK